MIRKYHNHNLQTNPWHRKSQTPGRQTKQSNQLSSPHRDDCKLEWTQSNVQQNKKTITKSQNGSNNQQRINNNRTTALERTAAKATGGGGGLNAFYWL